MFNIGLLNDKSRACQERIICFEIALKPKMDIYVTYIHIEINVN